MLNNRSLGTVRPFQEVYNGSRYFECYMYALPDFEKLAESYGHVDIIIDFRRMKLLTFPGIF